MMQLPLVALSGLYFLSSYTVMWSKSMHMPRDCTPTWSAILNEREREREKGEQEERRRQKVREKESESEGGG